jgi:hypothetical protein
VQRNRKRGTSLRPLIRLWRAEISGAEKLGCRLWEQSGLLQLRPAAGERKQLVGCESAPLLRHCLGGLRLLRWRTHEAGRRLKGLGLGLGLVHQMVRGRRAIPERLVLRLAGPSRVPAFATIDNAVGPVVAVAGDTLWLAPDEVAAARDVNQSSRQPSPCP